MHFILFSLRSARFYTCIGSENYEKQDSEIKPLAMFSRRRARFCDRGLSTRVSTKTSHANRRTRVCERLNRARKPKRPFARSKVSERIAREKCRKTISGRQRTRCENSNFLGSRSTTRPGKRRRAKL